MTRNLKIFIGITSLITLGFILADKLISRLPDGPQAFASLVYIVVFLWIVFDLVVKIIYRLVGIPAQTKAASGKKVPIKLTHQQAAEVGRLWMAGLITNVVTGVVYALLFDRQNWKSILLGSGVFMVLILLSFINSKKRLMGHTKKELFQ